MRSQCTVGKTGYVLSIRKRSGHLRTVLPSTPCARHGHNRPAVLKRLHHQRSTARGLKFSWMTIRGLRVARDPALGPIDIQDSQAV